MTKLFLALAIAMTFSVGAFAQEGNAPAPAAPAVDQAPAAGGADMNKDKGAMKKEGKKHKGKHKAKKAM